jgi:copper(I)-binding protein
LRTAWVAALLLAAASSPGLAQVKVSDAWVRASVPQQKATGAFMRITAAQNMRLVEASSPVAGVVEIHEMRMDNQVMKMRAVTAVELPAGKTIELQPGGYHVMLMELKQTLKAGESVPIALVVETADKKRERIAVQATVRPLTAAAGKGHAH